MPSLHFLLGALLLAVFSARVGAAVIPVTDAHVRDGLSPYNWIIRDDALVSSVCGASLTVQFKGTSHVALMVESPVGSRNDPNLMPVIAWSVNGGDLRTHPLGLGEKSFVLSAGENDPLIELYIKGMSPFERRWDRGGAENSLGVVGFRVEEGAVTAPAAFPKGNWLNIGDSILSGDGALQPQGGGRPKVWAATGDARASYGYLLARHYGYRESRLAFGGYNWTGGMANVPRLSTLIDWHGAELSRLSQGRLQPPPDVVLINLGANGVPPEGEVVAALNKVRSRVGRDARLVVMVPTGGHARDVVRRSFDSYKAQGNDESAFLVDLGKVEFDTSDGLHPTAAGHGQIFSAARSVFDSMGLRRNNP